MSEPAAVPQTADHDAPNALRARVERLKAAFIPNAQTKWEAGLDRARLVSEEVGVRAREGAAYAEAKVRAHPLAALGLAAGVGLVLGALVSRRR